MRIAICAPSGEVFLIAAQIRRALLEENVVINDFRTTKQLAEAFGSKKYDMACIALNGAKGYEAVRKVREMSESIPIFWITDDRQFGMAAYELHIAAILKKPYTRERFAEAVKRTIEWGNG